MGRLASFLVIMASLCFLVFQPDSAISRNQGVFCDGFENGYITGFKQGTDYGNPRSPRCPDQPYKDYSDPESDYEHGYTMGYNRGYNAGRRYGGGR